MFRVDWMLPLVLTLSTCLSSSASNSMLGTLGMCSHFLL